MCIVAVYTTIGQKAEAVQCGIIFLNVFYSGYQLLVLKESAIFDLFGDTCQLLVYDTAGTDTLSSAYP